MALFAIVNPEQQPNAPEGARRDSAKFLNLNYLRQESFAAGSMVMQFIALAYVKHR